MLIYRVLAPTAAAALLLAGCTAGSAYSSAGYDPYYSSGYGYSSYQEPSYYAYPAPAYGVSFSYYGGDNDWHHRSGWHDSDWGHDNWHHDQWRGGQNQWRRRWP